MYPINIYQWTLRDSIQSHSAPSFGTGRFHRSSSCIGFFCLVIFYKLYHGKSSPSRPTTWENLFVGSPFSVRIMASQSQLPGKVFQPIAIPQPWHFRKQPSLRRCHGTRIYEVDFLVAKTFRWVGIFRVNLWRFGWKSCVHAMVADLSPGYMFGNKKKQRWYRLLDLNIGKFPGFGGLVQGQIYNLAMEASN